MSFFHCKSCTILNIFIPRYIWCCFYKSYHLRFYFLPFSCMVVRNAINFYTLIFVYSSYSIIIYLWILWSFLHKTVIICKEWWFCFFLFNLIPFLQPFSCPNVLPRISSVMSNHCDDGRHFCHCSVLNTMFYFLTIKYDVCWSLFLKLVVPF